MGANSSATYRIAVDYYNTSTSQDFATSYTETVTSKNFNFNSIAGLNNTNMVRQVSVRALTGHWAVGSVTFDNTAVPEPSSFGLAIAGLTLAGLRYAKRR
jgi:hypothetical protein